jgi:hypothetical protein
MQALDSARCSCKHVESEYDQGITGQHRQPLAISLVDGRPAAPNGGVIETGQIVVDQGRTMQKFDRGGCSVGEVRFILLAGGRHREAEPWTDAGTPREYGVAHRSRESWWRINTVGLRDRLPEGLLYPCAGIHDGFPTWL